MSFIDEADLAALLPDLIADALRTKDTRPVAPSDHITKTSGVVEAIDGFVALVQLDDDQPGHLTPVQMAAQVAIGDRPVILASPNGGMVIVGNGGLSGTGRGGGGFLTITSVKTTDYMAAVEEFVPVDLTSASVLVALPANPDQDSRVGVKVVKTGTGTLTVQASGLDVYNVAGGQTSVTLDTINDGFIAQYSSGVWYILGEDLQAGLLYLVPTAVQVNTYAAAPGDFVPCDTTAVPFTVTLPTTPATGAFVGASLITQDNARTNHVAVVCGGTDLLDNGSTSLSLATVGERILLEYATGVWSIINHDGVGGAIAPTLPTIIGVLADLPGDISTASSDNQTVQQAVDTDLLVSVKFGQIALSPTGAADWAVIEAPQKGPTGLTSAAFLTAWQQSAYTPIFTIHPLGGPATVATCINDVAQIGASVTSIAVDDTSTYPASGHVALPSSGAVDPIVKYTSKNATHFLGCTLDNAGAGTNGSGGASPGTIQGTNAATTGVTTYTAGAVVAVSFQVASTASFNNAGIFRVVTAAGFALIKYTSTDPTHFLGCVIVGGDVDNDGVHIASSVAAGAVVDYAPVHVSATVEDVAAGAYDAHYVALANSFKTAGFTDVIVRMWSEMNLPLGYWSQRYTSGPSFVAAWKRIVSAMRGVGGITFKYVWAPSHSGSYNNQFGFSLGPWVPFGDDANGDPYFDYCGMDIYDQDMTNTIYGGSMSVSDQRVAVWRNLLHGLSNLPDSRKYGLDWLGTFAAANSRPIIFPEWGLWSGASHGGGDNPDFIRYFSTWLKASTRVVAACYQQDHGGFPWLSTAHNPLAQAEFNAQWLNGGGGVLNGPTPLFGSQSNPAPGQTSLDGSLLGVGPILSLRNNPAGSAGVADGALLGIYGFGGYVNGTDTDDLTAYIAGYAREDFTATANGSGLSFWATTRGGVEAHQIGDWNTQGLEIDTTLNQTAAAIERQGTVLNLPVDHTIDTTLATSAHSSPIPAPRARVNLEGTVTFKQNNFLQGAPPAYQHLVAYENFAGTDSPIIAGQGFIHGPWLLHSTPAGSFPTAFAHNWPGFANVWDLGFVTFSVFSPNPVDGNALLDNIQQSSFVSAGFYNAGTHALRRYGFLAADVNNLNGRTTAVTTVAAIAGSPVNVSSLPSTITVTDASGFPDTGPPIAVRRATVVTSTGIATIAYTGTSGNDLTGCTLLAGTGTITNGAHISNYGLVDYQAGFIFGALDGDGETLHPFDGALRNYGLRGVISQGPNRPDQYGVYIHATGSNPTGTQVGIWNEAQFVQTGAASFLADTVTFGSVPFPATVDFTNATVTGLNLGPFDGADIFGAAYIQRHNTFGAAPIAVTSGNVIGALGFRGYDGAQYGLGAWIFATVSEPVGYSDAPNHWGTRLEFGTTPIGSGSIPTTALRLGSDQLATFYGNVTAAGNIGFNGKSPQAQHGWAKASPNTISRTAFNPATISTPNLAQKVAGLISDLVDNGVI